MKYLPTFQTIGLNPPSPRITLRPILIYFEFRGKPSLTVIFMDPHSPNKLIVTKCCFLILGNDTSFFFFLSFFFVFMLCYDMLCYLLCYYKVVNKNYFIIILFHFFHRNYFNFFMFRDVSECSICRLTYRRPRGKGGFGRRYLTKIAILKYL